jgi:hypothetical protein
MNINRLVVEEAEAFEGRSAHHAFTSSEKADYDSLNHRGRTLYDNLRTLHPDLAHAPTFHVAKANHGLKPTPTH